MTDVEGGSATNLAGGGGQAPGGAESSGGDFLASISDENRETVRAKGWQGVDEIVAGYRNLETIVGKRDERVSLPGPDATPEDLSDFYSKLGKPESSEGYEITRPDGSTGPDLAKWFSDLAFEANLTRDQAAAIHDAYSGKMAELFEEQQASIDERQAQWNEQLRKDLGNAYDERTRQAVDTIRALLPDDQASDLLGILEDTGLGDYPPLVHAFINMAQTGLVGEDKLGGAAARTNNSASTPGEVDARITKLMGKELPYDEQRKLPYWDAQHPDHAASVREVQKLQETRDPDAKKLIPGGINALRVA